MKCLDPTNQNFADLLEKARDQLRSCYLLWQCRACDCDLCRRWTLAFELWPLELDLLAGTVANSQRRVLSEKKGDSPCTE